MAAPLKDTQSGHNASVDALRGLAAAMVVFFHMSQCGFQTLSREWVVLGALGVNLFFTLSGFLIGRAVLQPACFDTRKYFRNRSLRILPNYFICCFIMLFVVEGRTIAHSTPAHLALDLSTHAMLIHGWFGSVASSIIGPLWTLSHEWTFYVLIGVSATLLRSVCGWSVPLAMLLVALVAKQMIVRGLWHLPAGIYNPLCYWDQFAMGIFGAQLAMTAPFWKWRVPGVWLTAMLGLLLVGWCVQRQLATASVLNAAHLAAGKVIAVKTFVVEFTGVFFKKKSNVVWLPSAFSAGVALLLVSVTAGFERLNSWIKKTPLPWLGKVSYSTYLYHMAVILCLTRGFGHRPDGALFGITGAAVVVALIGVYALSAFCFHFFEKPWLVRKAQPAAST